MPWLSNCTRYLCLDVHAEAITAAIAEGRAVPPNRTGPWSMGHKDPSERVGRARVKRDPGLRKAIAGWAPLPVTR